MSKKGLTVSNDVRVKPSVNSSKLNVNRGAKQAIGENLKTAGKATKAETKANARGLKAANKPTNKTPSLAKTQAKGVAKLAGAGAATGAFTQIPAVKQSIKYQIEQANKNKKTKPSTKKTSGGR
jgi:hypothetical protein